MWGGWGRLLSPFSPLRPHPHPFWSPGVGGGAVFRYARGHLLLLGAIGQVLGGRGGFEESGLLSRSTSEKSSGKFPYPHSYSV